MSSLLFLRAKARFCFLVSMGRSHLQALHTFWLVPCSGSWLACVASAAMILIPFMVASRSRELEDTWVPCFVILPSEQWGQCPEYMSLLCGPRLSPKEGWESGGPRIGKEQEEFCSHRRVLGPGPDR